MTLRWKCWCIFAYLCISHLDIYFVSLLESNRAKYVHIGTTYPTFNSELGKFR